MLDLSSILLFLTVAASGSPAIFREANRDFKANRGELSSIRVRGLGSGHFGPFLGPRRYVSGRFGVSGERGQGGGSAQGLNRMGGEIGGDQACWNRSKALAAARGGALAGSDRHPRSRLTRRATRPWYPLKARPWGPFHERSPRRCKMWRIGRRRVPSAPPGRQGTSVPLHKMSSAEWFGNVKADIKSWPSIFVTRW